MKNLFLRKIFVLLLVVLFASPSSVLATVLEFAQISDMHYQPKAPKNEKSFKLKYYALNFIDDATSKINKNKNIDFTLVTGDAADKALPQDFEFIYKYLNQKLKKPWYYCLGNHDVSIKGTFTKKSQIDLLNKINPNGFAKDKTYYAFSPRRDMTFIGLDATYDNKVTSQGYLPPEQLNFLDNTIKNAKDDVIVIFLHHPLTYPMQSSDHNIINDFAIKEILKKYDNPILVLGGHFHACKIEQDGHIIEVASPALVTYPNAFRIIKITNRHDKTIFDIGYEDTDLKDLQQLAKTKLTWGVKWATGKDSDRKSVIVIDKKCKTK